MWISPVEKQLAETGENMAAGRAVGKVIHRKSAKTMGLSTASLWIKVNSPMGEVSCRSKIFPAFYQGLTQIETLRDKPWGFSIYAVVFKGGNGYNCTRQIPAKGRPPAQEKDSIRGMPGLPGGSGNWTKGAKRERSQSVQSARQEEEPGAAGRAESPVTGSRRALPRLRGAFKIYMQRIIRERKG